MSENDPRRYCPVCAAPLAVRTIETHDRLCCPECDYVFWDNPTPVVAAIVEYDNRLLLARNAAWPEGMFGLITGFLEPCEEPADGVVREVAEETALGATINCFVGAYGFARKNQLLLAYHVHAGGQIRLNEELIDYRLIEKHEARYWPGGTGLAVRDWLRGQGYDPAETELPPAVRAVMQQRSR